MEHDEVLRSGNGAAMLQMPLTDLAVLAMLERAAADAVPVPPRMIESTCAMREGDAADVLERLTRAGLVGLHANGCASASATTVHITLAGLAWLDQCRGVLRRLQGLIDSRVAGTEAVSTPGAGARVGEGPSDWWTH